MAPSRNPEVVHEVIDGRAVLVDPAGDELITLNSTGSVIWSALDGQRDLDELVDHVLPRFAGVSRDELREDVTEFLRDLSAEGLVLDTSVS